LVSERRWSGRGKGDERVATIAELARDLGLRFREASLLDVQSVLTEAKALGKVNITEGTKGGRGREVDCWIPISKQALQSLEKGVATPFGSGTLSWRYFCEIPRDRLIKKTKQITY